MADSNTKGYKRFSDEQIQRANQVDLAQAIMSVGIPLKRVGVAYYYRDGYAVMDNWAFDHKGEPKKIYPVKFFMDELGYTFPKTMEHLLNGEQAILTKEQLEKNNVREPFIPPKKSKMRNKIYGYLMKGRHIDKDVLDTFIEKELIFQEDDQYGNIVFAGYDEKGEMKHAHKKSAGGKFRMNLTGSDAKSSFHWTGVSDTLHVFEAPIDMLSYICLHKENWQEHTYVALNGVSSQALFHRLNINPKIINVYLCLDHDVAGDEAMSKMRDQLKDKGYSGVIRLSKYKDWNEDIKVKFNEEVKVAEENPKYKYLENIIDKLSMLEIKNFSKISSRQELINHYGNLHMWIKEKGYDINMKTKNTVATMALQSIRLIRSLDSHLSKEDQLNIYEDIRTGYRTYKDKSVLKQNSYLKNNNSYKGRMESLELKFKELHNYILAGKIDLKELRNHYMGIARECVETHVLICHEYGREQSLNKLDVGQGDESESFQGQVMAGN